MVEHKFVEKSFKTPTFCHVCQGFILGLGKKASRCSECYLVVHKKCVAKAPDNCIDKTAGELVPDEDTKWLDIEKNADLSDYYKKKDPYDDYKQLKELGQGGGGTVYEVEDKKTGKHFALKELAKDSYDLYLLEREILIMKDLSHPGLIAMEAAYMGEKQISLILELVLGGELFERIVANQYFSEKDASEIAQQCFEALAYVHEHGVAHRDIKAENVLLVDKKSNKVKIADFGLANALGEASRFQSCVGTTDYMAPEMLESLKYGFGVDIWSMGVLTYIMLCGYPPFYAGTENEKVEKILSGQFDFEDEVWDLVSESGKNFICHLLVLQPKARFTAKQALRHPWCTQAALEQTENRSLPSLANLSKMQQKNAPKESSKSSATSSGKDERRKKKKDSKAKKTKSKKSKSKSNEKDKESKPRKSKSKSTVADDSE